MNNDIATDMLVTEIECLRADVEQAVARAEIAELERDELDRQLGDARERNAALFGMYRREVAEAATARNKLAAHRALNAARRMI